MHIKLRKNKRAENLKSILYCAIHFGDFDCIESILHPNGEFVGMNKHRFIYFLRKEFFNKNSKFISADSQIWSVLIDVGNFPGERCFIFNRDNKDKNLRTLAYVFIIHPHQNKEIWKIVKTTSYLNENLLNKSTLMFKKKYGKKFNNLFIN